MLQIDLSIIIPVYNAVPLLERCLNSIFIQTTQYSYEVILVDDGSTDNSVEVIKARPERNIVLPSTIKCRTCSCTKQRHGVSKRQICSFY